MLDPDWPWPTGGWYGKIHVGLCGFYAYLTGDPELKKKYREQLLAMIRRDHGWMLHGFNHFPYITYDLLEEDPVFSDEDRLEITKAMLRVLDSGEGVSYGYAGFPRNNHATRAWMDNYFGTRYFAKYYRLPEAEAWMEKVDAFFAPHVDCSKPYEDSNGHSWGASLDNIASYALASGHFEYFDNGMIRRAADRLIVNTNNIGSCTLVGCCGSGIYTALLSKAAIYYDEPGYYYPIHRMPELNRRWIWSWDTTPGNQHHCDEIGWPYDAGRQSEPPKWLCGVVASPVEKAFYKNVCGGPDEDFDRAFDKISFRRGFDPQDEYLLLDGLSGGGHSYDDANTILEVTACGRLWLNPVHMEYGPTNLRDFNGVMVLRDGRTVRPPRHSTLQHSLSCNELGYTQTAMRGLGGADWLRNIFWLPGRGFVVLDDVRFTTAGQATLGCRWYGFGRPKLDGRALVLEQGNTTTGIDRFRVQCAGSETLSLSSEHSVEFETGRIAYALDPDDVPDRRHRFQELTAGDFKISDRHVFANLLWPLPAKSAASGARLARLGPRECALIAQHDVWRFGLLDEDVTSSLADTKVSAQAAAYALSSDYLFVIGTKSLSIGGQVHTFPSPKYVRLDLAAGRLEACKPDEVMTTSIDLTTIRAELAAALDRQQLAEMEKAYLAETAGGESNEVLGVVPQTVWQAQVAAPVLDLATADLDGDGRADVIVADEGGKVTALGTDGSVRWQWTSASLSSVPVPEGGGRASISQSRREAPGPVNSVCVFDMDADGKPDIAAGSDDGKVHLLSADGKHLWDAGTPVRGPHDAWMSMTTMAKKVVAGDVDGDGRGEIAVGFSNSHVHLLDAEGNERWHREMQYGTPMRLTIADIDGKPGAEIVGGCGFPSVESNCHAYWADGRHMQLGRDRDRNWSARRSLRAVVVADVIGDDGPDVIYGTDTAIMQVAIFSNLQFAAELEVGGNISALQVAELAGGGKPEILVGTQNGLLSCFAGGEPTNRLWYRSLKTGIRDVAIVPVKEGSSIIVGCEDGSLWRLDAGGEVRSRTATGSPIALVRKYGRHGQTIVARQDGTVELVAW
jgi:hypothetical protein